MVRASGNYSVVYTNAENCDSTIIINLQGQDCEACSFYMPNVVTAKKDNLNDNLEWQTDCEFTAFKLEIYNRWGELLYQKEDPTAFWDIEYLETRVPQGIYFYTLRYTADLGVKTSTQGTIYVLD